MKKKSNRKYSRRKYSRRKYSRRKSRKNVKNNLVGGGKVPGEHISHHELLLKHKEWYVNPVNINNFLKDKFTDVPNNPKLNSENLKEVRIASFTNFYRIEIYKLVNIIDTFFLKYIFVFQI